MVAKRRVARFKVSYWIADTETGGQLMVVAPPSKGNVEEGVLEVLKAKYPDHKWISVTWERNGYTSKKIKKPEVVLPGVAETVKALNLF